MCIFEEIIIRPAAELTTLLRMSANR
jgi:hypothetical protein